ncbi:N-acetylneuraminate synthase [Nonlabens dokdonensis]|jgi:N-acetylneuraminate synthase/N,N'-diacetyllegionaminate synthase|uniref:N-acetylneuraminate synthase n=2 Tax=Nonlabens dokdonensis TaxID=328515 RepID=L7WFE6_NONDD|nr:N-acetylneuraminate synthase [Nonlabens dokdonensis]AGC78681.1 N-acetylneuraminate synthase [Nonlabens dokdonensis DSW-6]PZX39192.1 N-acetylneuraminate synthase [Nonlabens dokdonensis]
MQEKTLIIAEAGVNHNGSLDRAIELIKVAAQAGVDYVKFQTFKTELNISKSAKKAEYQKNNTEKEENQYEMVKKLELTYEEFLIVEEKCREFNVGFMSTAFDLPSIDFLDSFNPKYFKIPSGEITNYSFLKAIAQKGKRIILSTGMASLGEIENALEVLLRYGVDRENITVLHCNTEYPTPMNDVNLKAMNVIGDCFGVRIGYSDHTLGIEVPTAAVALGAKVIEKHFTLDRTLPGPDHNASLEPEELVAMVKAIRNIEQAIGGSGRKERSPSESKNVSIARKSIHTKTDLVSGKIITEDDIIALRPGDGISPMKWDDIIGKKLKGNKTKFEKLSWIDFV